MYFLYESVKLQADHKPDMHITHPSSHHEADACGAHPVCSTMRRPSRAQHTQCPSRTAPPLADAWRRVHVPRTETSYMACRSRAGRVQVACEGRKFGHMGCRASLGKSESRPDCARRAPRRRRARAVGAEKFLVFKLLGGASVENFLPGRALRARAGAYGAAAPYGRRGH